MYNEEGKVGLQTQHMKFNEHSLYYSNQFQAKEDSSDGLVQTVSVAPFEPIKEASIISLVKKRGKSLHARPASQQVV